MANRIATAALQYSKWLSRFICWIWAIYRFAVLIVSAIQPSVAEAIVSTITGVDTIMLVNEGTYLVNSLGEKYIYSDRFVMSWIKKGGFNSLVSRFVSNDSSNKDEDPIEEDTENPIEETTDDPEKEPIDEEGADG